MCLPIQPFKIEREWIGPGGLHCAVVQQQEAGIRCGYVRVPPTHAFFGKDYDDVPVDVHGGLTFAHLEPCVEHKDGQGWWFGFDCAHLGDMMFDPNVDRESLGETGKRLIDVYQEFPALNVTGFDGRPCHYWLEQEVADECEALADQLAKLGKIKARKMRRIT